MGVDASHAGVTARVTKPLWKTVSGKKFHHTVTSGTAFTAQPLHGKEMVDLVSDRTSKLVDSCTSPSRFVGVSCVWWKYRLLSLVFAPEVFVRRPREEVEGEFRGASLFAGRDGSH